jgi:hypothetical protein
MRITAGAANPRASHYAECRRGEEEKVSGRSTRGLSGGATS